MISRRRFSAALGGLILVAPSLARAQGSGSVRRIGVLMQLPANDAEAKARVGALLDGLRQLGWIEGRNLRVDYRQAANGDQARTQSAELIAFGPDCILAVPIFNIRELQRQTRTIPLVFVNILDPVQMGLVASLAHPGGNTTGFLGTESTIAGKWLELLKQIAPGIHRVLVVMNADSANQACLKVIEDAARSLEVRVSSWTVINPDDIERTIATVSRESKSGLICLPGGPVTAHRKFIIDSAMRHQLPAIYGYPYYADEGGLMSYGTDVLDLWLHAASYVDRILKGERAAELPVQTPSRFQLVINMKTARALQLTVPQELLLRADRVIE